MGFIGRDDSGDPVDTTWANTLTTADTSYSFAADTATGASITIPMMHYCGHCPRRFSEEQDYEFHIMWHMLDTIITEFRASQKPKKKKWWGKLKDIEK